MTSVSTAPSRPVAIDLFSGAGGFALGVEQAGFDVVAAVEYDPVHAAVHEFNFPTAAVVCADARHVTADRLAEAVEDGRRRHGHRHPWNGEVDLVFGGPPCQGFSVIGARRADDRRNDLSFAFVRIVRQLRPRSFILENVPGMPSAPGADARPLLVQLVVKLRSAGYRVGAPAILNASDFGVPQDRRRLVVVGARSDSCDAPLTMPSATVRPVPKRPGDRPTRQADRSLPCGPTVTDAIADLPDLDDYDELFNSDTVVLDEAARERGRTVVSQYATAMREPWTAPDDLSRVRDFDRTQLTSSLRTGHAEQVIARFDATAPGAIEPVSRFYRLHPDGLSATLRAGTGYDRGSFNAPRPLHPHLPRVVSVREAARLHSVPDWFRLHATKWHGFRQLGNAVPPYLACAVAASVRDQLGMPALAPAGSTVLGPPTLLTFSMREAAAHFGVDIADVPHHGLRQRGTGRKARSPTSDI